MVNTNKPKHNAKEHVALAIIYKNESGELCTKLTQDVNKNELGMYLLTIAEQLTADAKPNISIANH